MKKLIALLLILSISMLCIFSCKKKDKDDGKNDGTGDGTSDVGGPTEESEDDTVDNIDPDGWTKVEK